VDNWSLSPRGAGWLFGAKASKHGLNIVSLFCVYIKFVDLEKKLIDLDLGPSWERLFTNKQVMYRYKLKVIISTGEIEMTHKNPRL
jgi:hypothetical protein